MLPKLGRTRALTREFAKHTINNTPANNINNSYLTIVHDEDEQETKSETAEIMYVCFAQ